MPPPLAFGHGPVPLRPLGLGEILDGAFKLLKANAAGILAVSAIFVIPVQLVSAFLQRDLLGGQSFFDYLNDPSTSDAVATSDADSVMATLVSFAFAALIQPLVAGSVARIVGAAHLGEPEAWTVSLRSGLRSWPALVGSWFVVHLLEALALVGPVLAGLALGAAVGGSDALFGGVLLVTGLVGVPLAAAVMTLSVAVAPAVSVERLGPVAGVRRSWRLLRHRFWPTLGIALLSGLIAGVLGSVLGAPAQIVGLVVGLESYGWLLVAVGGIVATIVTAPFVAIVATLVYVDARVRREALDLQLMARDLSS